MRSKRSVKKLREQRQQFFALFMVAYLLCASTPRKKGLPPRVLRTYKTTREALFDTNFLAQPRHVRTLLEKEGFVQEAFQSADHLRLECLYLARPNARCNLIFTCGWWPGLKESIATFYALAPNDCNILFFDARGHGKSEGDFFSWRYGCDEYNDIIGALRYLKQNNNLPTIVHGLCAGAFHSVHALRALKSMKEHHAVCGLIFDSGWASITHVSRTTPDARMREWIRRAVALITGRHYNDCWVKCLNIVQTICTSITTCYNTLYDAIAVPRFKEHENTTCLHDKMHELTIPTLFIHAHDDEYALCSEVEKLAQQTAKAECWWITQRSKHACNHLKHTDEYEQRMAGFIDLCLTETSASNTPSLENDK